MHKPAKFCRHISQYASCHSSILPTNTVVRASPDSCRLYAPDSWLPSGTYCTDRELESGDIEFREGGVYLGIQASAGGSQGASLQYTIYEVSVDAMYARVRSKLPEEAARCAPVLHPKAVAWRALVRTREGLALVARTHTGGAPVGSCPSTHGGLGGAKVVLQGSLAAVFQDIPPPPPKEACSFKWVPYATPPPQTPCMTSGTEFHPLITLLCFTAIPLTQYSKYSMASTTA